MRRGNFWFSFVKVLIINKVYNIYFMFVLFVFFCGAHSGFIHITN